MSTNTETVKQITTQYVDSLAQELEKLIAKNNSRGRIRSGSWIEKENIILGIISFTPHGDPEEESLELSVKTELTEKINLRIDICWSDGEIIETIANEWLIANLEDGSETQSITALWQDFLPIARNKMVDLMNRNLSPRYRKD